MLIVNSSSIITWRRLLLDAVTLLHNPSLIILILFVLVWLTLSLIFLSLFYKVK